MSDWSSEYPDIRALRVVTSDLNGVPRGKRLRADGADKLLSDGTKFPLSGLNVDIFGQDIDDSPLLLASGDQDGFLHATERGFLPVPWLETPTMMVPKWMSLDDGRPFAGDPRHALAAVERRYHDRGTQPVVAVELEFYLVDDSGDDLSAPLSSMTGKQSDLGDVLSVWELDRFDPFLTALYDACAAMGIPADTTISECGPGQFETTLTHQNSVLKAADDAWLFKMLIKGLARKHGFAATFMAKPYAALAGTGMHMHFSVLDSEGHNIFDDRTTRGTDTLLHSINGCLRAMADSTLIFAPHANSYARLIPGAHAPTGICWGYENRTTAIRVPSGPGAARRIEHRCAGGDINPYLMMAVILGAAMNGIEDAQMPPEPVDGNAYEQDMSQIPRAWAKATDAFAKSAEIARIFDPQLIDNYVRTKRQEQALLKDASHAQHIEVYLESV